MVCSVDVDAPFVPNVFEYMYCNVYRSSTTEDLISGMLVDDDIYCTNRGMCVALCLHRVSSSNSIPNNQVFGHS